VRWADQRNPTECGVFEYDCEASIKRRPWHTGGFCVLEIKNHKIVYMGKIHFLSTVLFKCHLQKCIFSHYGYASGATKLAACIS